MKKTITLKSDNNALVIFSEKLFKVQENKNYAYLLNDINKLNKKNKLIFLKYDFDKDIKIIVTDNDGDISNNYNYFLKRGLKIKGNCFVIRDVSDLYNYAFNNDNKIELESGIYEVYIFCYDKNEIKILIKKVKKLVKSFYSTIDIYNDYYDIKLNEKEDVLNLKRNYNKYLFNHYNFAYNDDINNLFKKDKYNFIIKTEDINIDSGELCLFDAYNSEQVKDLLLPQYEQIKKIPKGKYPVEVSIYKKEVSIVKGIRIKLSKEQADHYEIAYSSNKNDEYSLINLIGICDKNNLKKYEAIRKINILTSKKNDNIFESIEKYKVEYNNLLDNKSYFSFYDIPSTSDNILLVSNFFNNNQFNILYGYDKEENNIIEIYIPFINNISLIDDSIPKINKEKIFEMIDSDIEFFKSKNDFDPANINYLSVGLYYKIDLLLFNLNLKKNIKEYIPDLIDIMDHYPSIGFDVGFNLIYFFCTHRYDFKKLLIDSFSRIVTVYKLYCAYIYLEENGIENNCELLEIIKVNRKSKDSLIKKHAKIYYKWLHRKKYSITNIIKIICVSLLIIYFVITIVLNKYV